MPAGRDSHARFAAIVEKPHRVLGFIEGPDASAADTRS